MRHAWIIGANGLLGRALYRTLHSAGQRVFSPRAPLPWSDESRLLAQLEAAVVEFSQGVGQSDTWEIYWAAGVGTMASSVDELLRETVALGAFLNMLDAQPALRNSQGAIGFASSAGALYAGAADEVITEQTAVAPTTPYAHAKLEQEALIRAFTKRQDGVCSLTARISTLYGAGQSVSKKQGLLTHIARSIVRNKPIQVYVPFDTIRDYITATDAAARIILTMRRKQDEARNLTLIVASENPTTIAEIIATFKRVARRTPRVVTSVSRNTALYARKVQFRSISQAVPGPYPSTSLLVGIGQLLQTERLYFAQAASN